MNAQTNKLYLPLLAFFAVLNCFFLLGKNLLLKYGINQDVLIVGNLLVFFVTIVSLFFHIKGFRNNNAQVFLRGVYASLMIKMIVVAAAVLIYASTAAKLNRPAVYISMGLYFIYSFIEVRTIFRLMKQRKSE
ncbi:hypothetical protein ESA94_16795 [Lacibacter luteus]|uniref:ATP synthase subunit I n=1 Tax=Lacibacter luteus TaxID=2508719 RepID=A0A4Q1CEK9_9BACT|nr:hypothetical protein [Lacibacter luteus]RXK58304.1 hypothetical protein ESA94_16795 [Lacibacter luteus]